MDNSAYWAERFAQIEEAQHRKAALIAADIYDAYERAKRDLDKKIALWYARFAENNDITLAEAKQWLASKDLEEFKWDVWDFIQHGEENAIDQRWMKELENASARVHVSKYEALKIQLRQSLEELAAKYQGTMQEGMSDIYQSSFYHTAFEIQKSFEVGFDIAGVDQNLMEKVLSKPWAADGLNFSERIWNNKEKLVDTLNKELTQGIILGKDPQKIINAVSEKMDVSKVQAGRLVMTESAYFGSEARKDCFKELDVEQYVIVATLDNRTSETCREMDGKVFNMSDYKVGLTAPPFHVNCRTTTAPYFEDMQGIGDRAARDEVTGKTYTVPRDMKYGEWKKQFVKTSDFKTDTKSGIIKSLDVDDFNMIAETKEIAPEVSNVISETIKEYEKQGGMYISSAEFGDFYDEKTGKPALFQVAPNQYGMTVINVNNRLLGGKTIEEVNAMLAQTEDNLPQDLREAVIHECGHAKLIHRRSTSEIKDIYSELENIHISGVSPVAYSDGTECIAEVEVMLHRNSEVPTEAMNLYNKYVKGTGR